jgi:eukaryotic-like serine/threonine-protein kinase
VSGWPTTLGWGRDVALKVQQFDPAGDRVALERFQREAQSAAGLQHPNVVTIFDSGIDGDTAFLVMELLPGPTLEAYVAERGPLPEREAVALAAAVASGLSAAHRAGVVHRDIKPTNLMFDTRGGLKIVDFGIARLAQTATSRLTATNTVVGSAPYLGLGVPAGADRSPQVKGRRVAIEVDPVPLEHAQLFGSGTSEKRHKTRTRWFATTP